MDLTTDVIFLVVSSVNSDLFSYIFATGVGCKIRYVDITGLKNIPSVSARVTCIIKFSVEKARMLRLKIWILSFLNGSRYLS